MLTAGCTLLSLALALAPPATAPSAAGAPGGSPRLGLLPVVVEGEVPDHVPERIGGGVREGLASDRFEVSDVVAPCASAECHQDLARTSSTALFLRVTTTAAEPDYVLRFDMIDPADASVVASKEISCDICTYDEVVAAARDQAAAMATTIADDLSTREPIREEPPAPMPTPERPGDEPLSGEREGPAVGPAPRLGDTAPDRPGRVRPRVVAGGALVGVAIPALVGGITMIALEERNYGPKCSDANTDANGVCEFRHKSLEAGVALTVLGAASAATGAVLIITGRKQQRTVQALVGPARLGLRASF